MAKPVKKKREPVKQKTCSMCHETKTENDFYFSASPMFSLDERIPFCKECCINYALNVDGSIDYKKFKDLLMRTDTPLYYDILERINESFRKKCSYATDAEIRCMGKEMISDYYRRMGGKGYRGRSFLESEQNGFIGPYVNNLNAAEKREIKLDYDARFNGGAVVTIEIDKEDKERTKFDLTPEIKEMFGDGFSLMEYKKMKEKYDKLKQNYQIQTSLHEEALITYVRFKVKEEIATANGMVNEAKKWYDAAQNAADKAKLSPKQLTKADLQKGLNSFSEISQALEQAVDIIEVLPRYKSQPVDSVDFNIWCYINYARKLKGLPIVEYEDIYKFYDDMKDDYLSQYGDPYEIFEDDVTVKNRDNVEKFITLPADYEDIGINEEEGEDE